MVPQVKMIHKASVKLPEVIKPQITNNVDRSSQSLDGGNWIRIRLSEVVIMRNLFKEIDVDGNSKVNINQLMESMEQRGPSSDSVKVRFRTIFETVDRETASGMTFTELLALCYPKAPSSQLRDVIQRVAPLLGDNDTERDFKVRADLDSLGAVTQIVGETKQQRRLRLAVLRSSLDRHSLGLDADKTLLRGGVSETSIIRDRVLQKPIIRVNFQKRSEQAKRLMEYCNIRRNLLTMDGLPLHTHPALQLGGGSDVAPEDLSDSEMSEPMTPTGSVGSRRQASSNEKPVVSQISSPVTSPVPFKLERRHRSQNFGGSQRNSQSKGISKSESTNVARNAAAVPNSNGEVVSVYANLFRKYNMTDNDRSQLLACVEKQDIDGLSVLFESLSNRKLRLDSSSLHQMMKVALACERPDQAVHFFATATMEDSEPTKGKQMCSDPDVGCYNALIEAHGRMGNLISACNLRPQMESKKVLPSGETFNSWIRAAIMNDNLKLATSYVQEMEERGFADSLSRDIKYAFGVQFEGAESAEGSGAISKTTKSFNFMIASQFKSKKLELVNVAERAEHAKVERSVARDIAKLSSQQSELLERIENLKVTKSILDDLDAEDDDSDTRFVQARLLSMEASADQLDEKIRILRNKIQTDAIDRNQTTLNKQNTGFEESTRSEIAEEKPPQEKSSGDMQVENATQFENNVEGRGIQVMLQSQQGHSSVSGGLKFLSSEQPSIVTKTIFAAPKNYSSGEFTIVVALLLSVPVKSHKNDRVTILIKNLKDLLNRDCDFLPVFGTGGRLCVNGGAKWKRSAGCIMFEIADESVIPADYAATFRFSLNVDVESNHPSVIPTIEMFNSSGTLDIPAVAMDGKILEYTPSTTKVRLRKGIAAPSNVAKPALDSNGNCVEGINSAMERLNLDLVDQTKNFEDWGCNLGTGETKKQEYCFDQGFLNSWRSKVVKVFVCAQVREMQRERQYLCKTVLPALQSICQKLQVVLIWVDLRAGMLSDDGSHPWTLKVLLDEASRCHYFVCMIGQDYGWYQPVPIHREVYDAALKGARVLLFKDAPDDNTLDKCSVEDEGSASEEQGLRPGINIVQDQGNLDRLSPIADRNPTTAQSRSRVNVIVPQSLSRRGSKIGNQKGNVQGVTTSSAIFQRGTSPGSRRGSATLNRGSATELHEKLRTPNFGSQHPIQTNSDRAYSFYYATRNSSRGTSPEHHNRGGSVSPERARPRPGKSDPSQRGSKGSLSRLSSPNGRKPVARRASFKSKVQSPSPRKTSLQDSDDDDANEPGDSVTFEDVHSPSSDVILPAGADMQFFLNQLDAMKFGHPWIIEHLDCGLLELEILNRLLSNQTSRHRNLIALRSAAEATSEVMPVEPEAIDFISMNTSETCTMAERSKKKLLNLKKKLMSGELGNLDVTEYSDPIAGADSLGRRLEKQIRADWVNRHSSQQAAGSYRVLKMEDFHRSFASICVAGTKNLNSELEGALMSWLSFPSDSGPFVLHGPPGCGRSALLAKLWRSQSESKIWTSVVIHFAEVDADGFNAMLRCCYAFDEGISNIKSLPGRFKEICEMFVGLQAKAAQTFASRDKKILLVIDGVDDLVDEDGASVDLCEYLPNRLSSNVKMVISLKSDHESLGWPVTHQWALNELRPISKSDKHKLVQKCLDGKRPAGFGVFEKWASKFNRTGFHVRSLSLLLSSLSQLSGLSNIEEITTSLNPISTFWNNVIRFSEEVHGPTVVRIVLVCITLCRDGISRSEIVDLLDFAKGGIPGQSERDIPLNSTSLLMITQVLWPFETTNNLWDRGDLMNAREYVKPIIKAYYSLESDLKIVWHEFLAEFFSRPGANPDRVVREYPYHVMHSNNKDRLKRFLLNPRWNMELISQHLCNDIFCYWRWLGKSSLSESYMAVFLQPQCWGCMSKSVRKVGWVEDYIERGLAQQLEDVRVAEGLEQEIFRRTGKRLWLQQDIVEHIRFHSVRTHSGDFPSTTFDLASNTELFMTINRSEEVGFVINWDDANSIQWLRVVLQVLRDGVERITIPMMSKKKETKLRVSKVEELKKTLPREISVIRALSRILLLQNVERMQQESTTKISDNSIHAHDNEIEVESVQELGISSMANLPATIKIGEEVMTVTKVNGNKLTVARTRRRRVHECSNSVTFTLKLSKLRFVQNSAESYPEPQAFLQQKIAIALGVRLNQVEIAEVPNREVLDTRKSKEKDIELECRVTCEHFNFESANAVQSIIEEVLMSSSETGADDEIICTWSARPVHHFYKPTVFAQVVIPTRMLAFDYYWCGYMSYVAEDKEDCARKILKATHILEAVCPTKADHLLVQCKVFAWLLLVERGKKRGAREKAQEFSSLLQNFFRSTDQMVGATDLAALRAMTATKLVLCAAKEADDVMMGEIQARFEEKLQVVRKYLTPPTLLDLEAASFLHLREMWMVIRIEEASDLLAMDLSGTSDPFCTISVDGTTKQTRVHKKCLNIKFDEELLFTCVRPEPTTVILLDVWDWDGPGRQDLIGFAQINLRGALDREGELTTFALNRTQKGKGIQADGIKLGRSGSCGHLAVRFELSHSLRMSLLNANATSAAKEAPIVHQVTTSSNATAPVRWISIVDPETWDETIPVSASDEPAWIQRLTFLGQTSESGTDVSGAVVEAAKSYFEACREQNILPSTVVLDFIESILTAGTKASTAALCLRSCDEGNPAASIRASMVVIERLACPLLECGGCEMDGKVALSVAATVSKQPSVQTLCLQENVIGGSPEGLEALLRLINPNFCSHITNLCVSSNKLTDPEIAKVLSDLARNSCLLKLDISHNCARSMSATALGQMLMINTSLTDLDCSWNQFGLDSFGELVENSNHQLQSKHEIIEKLPSNSNNCKKMLLMKDHDGRWARHLLNGQDKFRKSLLHTCNLFDLEQEAQRFLFSYQQYLESAQHVKLAQDKMSKVRRKARPRSLLSSSESAASVVLVGLESSELETRSQLAAILREKVALFQEGRDSMFRLRGELMAAIDKHRMKAAILKALTKAVPHHPLFVESWKEMTLVERDIICAGLKVNSSLRHFDVSRNNLGGCDSVQLCEAVAAALCDGQCRLELLNLAYNKIVSHDALQQVGLIISALVDSRQSGSRYLQRLVLDGNNLGEASCRVLAKCAELNPTVEVSLRGCCNYIVHPTLAAGERPYGAYRLHMDQAASNLVRRLISIVCRKLGRFAHNTVRHTDDGVTATIEIPTTEYLRWETWDVPQRGVVSFDLEPFGDALTRAVMPTTEFADFVARFGAEPRTDSRRMLLSELSKSAHYLSHEQGQQLLVHLRDNPERCQFYLELGHLVLDADGGIQPPNSLPIT